MDTQNIIKKLQERQAAHRRYIHSSNHALADQLAQKLHDPGHFGAYLKLALTHDHQRLLGILGCVEEDKKVKSKAKLFMYLVQKSKK